jgi:hypothetical protein
MYKLYIQKGRTPNVRSSGKFIDNYYLTPDPSNCLLVEDNENLIIKHNQKTLKAFYDYSN